MAPPAPTRSHRNNFDALRLVGALCVVVSHQFAVAGRWEPRVIPDHSLGNLGVLIFFSISGYLVTLSWVQDPDLPRFLIRRFLRVWPALAVTVGLTLLLAVIFLPAGKVPPGIARYLYNVGFVRIDFPIFFHNPRPNINASLWTITFEVRWYLILGVAGVLLRDRLNWAVVVAGAGGLVFFFVHGGQFGFDLDSVTGRVMFLPYFGAFFLAGSLFAHFPILLRREGVLALVAGGMGLLFFYQGILGLLLVVPPAAIFLGTQSWPGINRSSRFGDLSYGLYLWAWPVQQVGILLLGKDAAYPLLLLVTLVLLIPLAGLSYHFIERPALGLKRRLGTKLNGSPAPVAA